MAYVYSKQTDDPDLVGGCHTFLKNRTWGDLYLGCSEKKRSECGNVFEDSFMAQHSMRFEFTNEKCTTPLLTTNCCVLCRYDFSAGIIPNFQHKGRKKPYETAYYSTCLPVASEGVCKSITANGYMSLYPNLINEDWPGYDPASNLMHPWENLHSCTSKAFTNENGTCAENCWEGWLNYLPYESASSRDSDLWGSFGKGDLETQEEIPDIMGDIIYDEDGCGSTYVPSCPPDDYGYNKPPPFERPDVHNPQDPWSKEDGNYQWYDPCGGTIPEGKDPDFPVMPTPYTTPGWFGVFLGRDPVYDNGAGDFSSDMPCMIPDAGCYNTPGYPEGVYTDDAVGCEDRVNDCLTNCLINGPQPPNSQDDDRTPYPDGDKRPWWLSPTSNFQGHPHVLNHQMHCVCQAGKALCACQHNSENAMGGQGEGSNKESNCGPSCRGECATGNPGDCKCPGICLDPDSPHYMGGKQEQWCNECVCGQDIQKCCRLLWACVWDGFDTGNPPGGGDASPGSPLNPEPFDMQADPDDGDHLGDPLQGGDYNSHCANCTAVPDCGQFGPEVGGDLDKKYRTRPLSGGGGGVKHGHVGDCANKIRPGGTNFPPGNVGTAPYVVWPYWPDRGIDPWGTYYDKQKRGHSTGQGG